MHSMHSTTTPARPGGDKRGGSPERRLRLSNLSCNQCDGVAALTGEPFEVGPVIMAREPKRVQKRQRRYIYAPDGTPVLFPPNHAKAGKPAYESVRIPAFDVLPFRQWNCCEHCGVTVSLSTDDDRTDDRGRGEQDRRIPGGSYSEGNLQILCRACNVSKGARWDD